MLIEEKFNAFVVRWLVSYYYKSFKKPRKRGGGGGGGWQPHHKLIKVKKEQKG